MGIGYSYRYISASCGAKGISTTGTRSGAGAPIIGEVWCATSYAGSYRATYVVTEGFISAEGYLSGWDKPSHYDFARY